MTYNDQLTTTLPIPQPTNAVIDQASSGNISSSQASSDTIKIPRK